MLTLSQQDPRWSSTTLGKTKFTVGRYGCLITDLSMGLDYYGMFKDPGTLAKTLKFTPDGLIIWESLSNVGLKLVKRGYGRNDVDMVKALKDPATLCLIQVNANHWVLGITKSILGYYNICDPWYGDRSTTKRYGNNITGYAIIAKL